MIIVFVAFRNKTRFFSNYQLNIGYEIFILSSCNKICKILFNSGLLGNVFIYHVDIF